MKLCTNCAAPMDADRDRRCRQCSPGRPPVASEDLSTDTSGSIDLDEALRLRDEGWSYTQLAGRYGVSRQWVHRCLSVYRARRAGEAATW